jgi:Na+-translocating membrane potential-generating system (MpsC)
MASSEADHIEDRSDGRFGVLAAISTEMVRLYKDQFGRGPNRVRTYWCGDDIVTTVLEDTLTPAERNLAKMGEHSVYATRACSSSTPPCGSSATPVEPSPHAP